MTVAEILARAREVLVEFDVTLIQDAETFDLIADERERVLDRIVLQDNPSYPLPGDTRVETDISAGVGPYTMPADFWRARRFTVRYASGTGRPRNIRLVPETVAHRVPIIIPAAYIRTTFLYPVDREPETAAERTWGWQNAETLDQLYLPLPAEVVDVNTELSLPDDAVKYMGRFVAAFMAIRARADDAVGALQGKATSALNDLLARTAAYPGQSRIGGAD